jgi:hypothetical protein
MDQTYYDTRRNHHYLFTINKIRSEGYATLEQAQRNPGSNIEYTIQVNDDANHVISNGQYAISFKLFGDISYAGDTIKITGAPGSFQIATVKALFPNQINSTIIDDLLSTSSITFNPAHSNFTLTSPSPSGTPALPRLTTSNQSITIDVAAGTPTPTEGTIEIKLGNITHKIVVKYQQ